MTYITVTENLVAIQCYKCGVWFGMPQDMNQRALKSGREFYCPNGHGQIYSESEEQRLKKKLSQMEFQVAALEKDRELLNKKVKNLKTRTKNGVCPCCHRQFVQLVRHMKTKHPEYE